MKIMICAALSTGLMTSLTGCENFNLNVNLGETSTAEIPSNLAPDTESCLSYHPTPKSVKAFMKAKNDTDPTIDPWAGWLLILRDRLPAVC